MGTISTYLTWRGDLTFTERPFCEPDNLALSLLSYMDLSGIVPAHATNGITIHEAYETYCVQERHRIFANEGYDELFSLMAHSKRFRNAKLTNFQEVFDEATATQFAAVCIELDDRSVYISFRGTDDTIVGWQEDFSMGSQIVPAQLAAVSYLESVMQPGRIYRVGGHSKGGNLALYASSQCKTCFSRQITTIYNNDGPGISEDILPISAYAHIQEKFVRIIPEFSVIGTLFTREKANRIVGSTVDGLLSHDALTWEIVGDSFNEKEDLSGSCKFYVNIFDQWITSADFDQRKKFTEDFFSALKSGGAKTIPEIAAGGVDGFGTILLSIVNSEKTTKIVMKKFIHSIMDTCKTMNMVETLKSKKVAKGLLLLVVGLFIMNQPAVALRLLGTGLGVFGIVMSIRKLLDSALHETMDKGEKKKRLISNLAVICFLEFIIANNYVAQLSSHLILGCLLLYFSFVTFRKAWGKDLEKWRQGYYLISAVIAALLGLVSLVMITSSNPHLVFVLGSFLVIYAVVTIGYAVFIKQHQMNQL